MVVENSNVDISKINSKELEDLLGIVKWAVMFSSHIHSPSCKKDVLCGKLPDGRETFCPHVGFHRELKRHYEYVVDKIMKG